MANFTPNKKIASNFNSGIEYTNNDSPSANDFNNIIESQLYSQNYAEAFADTPIIDNSNPNAGSSVELVDNVKEGVTYKKFKFINTVGAKGETGAKGDSGVASGTVNSNIEGTSDTDGYTQKAVNALASRDNLLLNPYFDINQRGQSSYTGYKYGLDRWLGFPRSIIAKTNYVRVSTNTAITSEYVFLSQRVEDSLNYLVGKYLTLSANIKSFTGTANIAIRFGDSNNAFLSISRTTITSGINTLTAIVPNNTVYATVNIAGVTFDTTDYIDIEWAKLEKGSVATICSRPLKATEMPKCLRYGRLMPSTSTPSSDPLDYGIPLRTAPTISNITIDGTGYKFVDAEIY